MSTTADAQARTLQQFIANWKTWTPEAVTASWSSNAEQQLLPFALGVPPKSKSEALQVLSKMTEVLTNYNIEVYNIVHDSARSKAALYMKSTADTPFENLKWNNEYAVFLTFTEDGNQVVKMEEMVDTALFNEFFPKFQKYLAEQQKST